MVRFPSIASVVSELREVRDGLGRGDDQEVDVRLQVYDESGWGWAIRVGSSDYDLDHRGYWGASSLSRQDKIKTLREIARDLIDQAKEQEASVR